MQKNLGWIGTEANPIPFGLQSRHPYQWPGSTMASMAAMAITLIWPLWRYGHSCHRRHSWSRQSIWVSKEASGPQDCNLWSWFCLNSHFKGKKLKIHAKIFFLYKFWKSFVYLVEKKGSGGSTSGAPRDLKFFLVVLVPKWNGISFGANSSQIFLHLGPP